MLSLIETRNRHFLEAARQVMNDYPPGRPYNFAIIAERAALSRAPHYYCTFDYALRMLRVLRHGRLRLRRDRRYEMWTEINDKCQALIDSRGMTLMEALTHVLAGESASQFFIAPSTALHLVQRLQKPSTLFLAKFRRVSFCSEMF